MCEARENGFDPWAVFKLLPQPEIWRIDWMCHGSGIFPSCVCDEVLGKENFLSVTYTLNFWQAVQNYRFLCRKLYIFIAPKRFGENESNKELLGSYVEKAIIILYCFHNHNQGAKI